MKVWKAVMLAAVLFGAVGSRAFAQGESPNQLTDFQLMVSRVLIVTPSGRVVMSPAASPETTEMLLKDAKPMEAGTLLLMHDGKVYMAPDRPAKNGEMMSKLLMSGGK